MAPLSSPTMKRLKKELEEIQDGCNSNDESRVAIAAFPLEDNFFEWHFTMTGPADSVYAEGLYHGKIKFPTNYPFAPPDIIFTTPSGRFDVGKKICLTVTGFHPESWQPAWSTRTILLALRHHMAIDDNAVGAVRGTPEERKKYAIESHKQSCSCGFKASEMLGNIKRAKDASSASSAASEDEDNAAEGEEFEHVEEEEEALENIEEKKRNNIPWILLFIVSAVLTVGLAMFIADI